MRRAGITISMVQRAALTKTVEVDACTLLRAIKTGRWQRQIRTIRRKFRRALNQTGDYKTAKRAVDADKKALPAIMFSGRFSRRANQALIEHSGLLCADLDGDSLNGELPMVREKLSQSPYVRALFVSPSGDGVKVIFRVPANASRHADSFRAIARLVLELSGKKIDQACKDVARLCFVSHDPEIYVNDRAREIVPLPPEPKRLQSTVADIGARQRAAVKLLGAIEWGSDSHGFLPCPGQHLHTTGDGARDCEIHLDGAPTLHCFHNHCRGILDAFNHELRSRIGKVESAEQTDNISSGNSADDEAITHLAALPPLEYERIREAEAEKLGCRVSVLDSLVNAKRLLSVSASDDDALAPQFVPRIRQDTVRAPSG
jgi:VirE-like protein